MNHDPSQPTNSESSKFKRFLELLGLDRGIDSTEELDQEIQELIDDGEEQGLISHQEGRMIHSILEFRGTVAKEIMTPGAEMVTVAANTSYDELIDLCNEHGFSRIPIYEDIPDNIIGILYAKDLLRYVNSQEKPTARDLAKPAYFALENQRIIHLLRDFQAKKVHLAIITDEFGIGMTTICQENFNSMRTMNNMTIGKNKTIRSEDESGATSAAFPSFSLVILRTPMQNRNMYNRGCHLTHGASNGQRICVQQRFVRRRLNSKIISMISKTPIQ